MKKPAISRLLRTVITLGSLGAFGFALSAFTSATTKVPTPRTSGPGLASLTVAVENLHWQESYTTSRTFIGRVEARQESAIGFEIPGSLQGIDVEEGDLVDKDSRIATLDTARMRAKRDELEAAVRQARARLELNAITLQRTREARQLNAVSHQAFDQADKDHLAAQADLERALAAVQVIDVDIQKATLRAPFDAVVAARYVDVGRVVEAGSPVFLLLERSRPEVRVGVSGDALKALSPGTVHPIVLGDRRVLATVSRILPIRDPDSRGVDVILTLDAEIDGIRRGDLARVSFENTVEEPGAWLPIQALTEGTRGLWAIYAVENVKEAAGVLQRHDIEVLHQETDRVYVHGSVPNGSFIVSTGLHRVVNGMDVRLQNRVVGEIAQ